ncbi:MAG: TonB-dependent receptor [Acidobacteria bacterium]|nr:TonB-dependent receptor [Acidobacteriota bacterium]
MKAFRTFMLGVAIVGVVGSSAFAQEPPPVPPQQGQKPPPPPPKPEDPTYKETVVVSASKVEQQLVDAPATMTVIGPRALETAPSNSYADLLRAVPGVNITQISARDINITSRSATSSLATSQLAVLDGRSLYQDFFGFVMWDFMPSNPNEIKQIEVIRGPASAVWGANAVSGVINVITKTPREMEGTSFLLGAGSFGREYNLNDARAGSLVYGNITHAQAINARWAYKLSVGSYQSEAFARPTGAIAGGSGVYPNYKNTGTSQPKIDLRFDYDHPDGQQRVVMSGGIAGTDGIMHTGIGPFNINAGTTFGYGKVNYSRGALRVQAFMNALNGDAENLIAVDTSGLPVNLAFDTKTFDFEVSNSMAVAGRHVLTYGGNLRYNKFELSLAQTETSRTEGGAYFQDEIFASDHVRFVVGARVDKFSSIDGAVFSPRVALLLKPSVDSTFRISFNRAFRAPSQINNNLDTVITNAVPLGLFNPAFGSAVFRVPTTAVGNPNLTEGRMDAFELSYTAIIANRATVSAAWYYTRFKDEIFFTQTGEWGRLTPPPGWPAVLGVPAWAGGLYDRGIRFPSNFTYLNLGRVNNQGLELGLDALLTNTTSGYVNYSFQAEPDPNFALSEVNLPPTHRLNAGLTFSGAKMFGSASVSYVGAAFWQDVMDSRFHGATPSYTTVNASLGTKWANGRYTASLKALNLTNRQVLQHVFADVNRRQIVGELRVNLPK